MTQPDIENPRNNNQQQPSVIDISKKARQKLRSRQYSEARELFFSGLEREPENATYLDTYAWVLFKNKNFEKALEMIEKALAVDKESSGEVFEHHGDILFRNNKIEEAKLAWKKAEAQS